MSHKAPPSLIRPHSGGGGLVAYIVAAPQCSVSSPIRPVYYAQCKQQQYALTQLIVLNMHSLGIQPPSAARRAPSAKPDRTPLERTNNQLQLAITAFSPHRIRCIQYTARTGEGSEPLPMVQAPGPSWAIRSAFHNYRTPWPAAEYRILSCSERRQQATHLVSAHGPKAHTYNPRRSRNTRCSTIYSP